MSRQFEIEGEIRGIDKDTEKILRIDAEKRDDVWVEIENGKIIMKANSLSKFRGLVNTYLRLMYVIREVEKIGRGKNN